jgi:HD-like signal output (HDOD) protein
MDSTDALLDQVVEVCPLPATTQRVLALTSSDTSSVPEVARVISTDPALAAAVMSVANSAAYGMGKIDRLEVAVMRLGLRELNKLAAAMALFAAFRNKAELTLQLHEMCVASGAMAHRLAKESNLAQPGTAFVCGLLSEIGAMCCLVFDGTNYVQLWEQAGPSIDLRAELERARYGATSFAIGRRFLERNSLPETVYAAVGSDLTQSPELADPLAKITLLSRHTPPLARAANNDATQLFALLDGLAQRVALSGVDGARLLGVWAQASASPELS